MCWEEVELKNILNNSIKWLIQTWGFFSPLQLSSSTGPVFSKSSVGINKVMYRCRSWTELTHSGISTPLQPPWLVMIIEAAGLGGVFPLVPYPFTGLGDLAYKRLVHAGAPVTAAKVVAEGKQQCRSVHGVLSLEFPTGNIFLFILFSNVYICQQLSVNRSGSGPGKGVQGFCFVLKR